MRILAHRGFLSGKEERRENTYEQLIEAVKNGFDVEFDVNLDIAKESLVLSHDETPWSHQREPARFIEAVHGTSFHALNVKNLLAIYPLTQLLEMTSTKDNIFLFDFELLDAERLGARFIMHSLSENGFHVAYRLSEREQFYEQYLHDEQVSMVWLDEFETPWITKSHIEQLSDKGIRSFVVSPELHADITETAMIKRWDDLLAYGVDGICTDYPLKLREHRGS